MCGIFCSLRTSYTASRQDHHLVTDENAIRILSERLKRANAARGPDAQHTTTSSLSALDASGSSSGKFILELYASELQLRGNAPIMQPHMGGGDILCWNGEVFEGLEIGPAENDGHKIFERFHAATAEPHSIPEIIGCIEGPYAFAFYQGSSKKLYFARDPLGRRSLLIHEPTTKHPIFLLTSVAVGDEDTYDFKELPTDGICILDLDGLREPENLVADFHSNFVIMPRTSGKHVPFSVVEKINRSLPPDDLPRIQDLDDTSLSPPLEAATEQFIAGLDRSVMLCVRDIPQALGDKGNAKIAVLFSGGIDSTMLAFLADRHIPPDEPIDLLNVAFENPRKIQVQANGNVGGLPKKRKEHLKMVEIDSSADREPCYMVPDRVTGLQEVEEMRRLCPARVWNFVEIDVPYSESQAARPAVEAMMYPSRTVMDASLASALYFASRGIGRVRDNPTSEYRSYTSPAKVLLSGVGSDEMLGGYARHRTVFIARGWQGVVDELQLELDRIPTRNLGRDDRIVSSHGKETRHPFLSLSIVSFLARLPVYLKLDPRLDVGVGDKTLLRLAVRRVGLVEASKRKKRAMQFGSHAARMDRGNTDRRGDLVIP